MKFFLCTVNTSKPNFFASGTVSSVDSESTINFFNGKFCAEICSSNVAKFFPAFNVGIIKPQFNYPAESQLKTFDDKKIFGIKTALNSNSFAAYRVDALKSIGGFPNNVILSEDMYVAAKMLLDGRKIFYNADAQVYHSHNYTATQEFHRYFDIGVFHSRESWIRDTFGSAEGAGKKFVLMKLKALWKENPINFFGAIFRDGAKFFGYRLGRLEKFLPNDLCSSLSMNKNYWRLGQ